MASPAAEYPKTAEFLMEEYKALRKEIEIRLAESRALEQYTALAVFGIWAWLISRKYDNYFVWAIPIVISLYSAFRRHAMNKYFNVLRKYLIEVEAAFGVNGWEHRERPWNIGLTETIFHYALVALSTAAWFLRTMLIAPVQ